MYKEYTFVDLSEIKAKIGDKCTDLFFPYDLVTRLENKDHIFKVQLRNVTSREPDCKIHGFNLGMCFRPKRVCNDADFEFSSISDLSRTVKNCLRWHGFTPLGWIETKKTKGEDPPISTNCTVHTTSVFQLECPHCLRVNEYTDYIPNVANDFFDHLDLPDGNQLVACVYCDKDFIVQKIRTCDNI